MKYLIGISLLLFCISAFAGLKEGKSPFKKVSPGKVKPRGFKDKPAKPTKIGPIKKAKKKKIFTAQDPFIVRSGLLKRLYLYKHTEKDSVRVKDEVLYERVYVRFSVPLDEWVFMLTDKKGYFANPPEVLMVGSVLPGYKIGSSNIMQNYSFELGGKWVPTDKTEVHRIVKLSRPPRRINRHFESHKKYKVEYPDRRRLVDIRKFYPEVIRYEEP